MSQRTKVATSSNINAVVRAAALTAREVWRLKGCGDPNRVDGLGSLKLATLLNEFLPNAFEMIICEGKKDSAPMIKEGEVFGPGAPVGVLIADPGRGHIVVLAAGEG